MQESRFPGVASGGTSDALPEAAKVAPSFHISTAEAILDDQMRRSKGIQWWHLVKDRAYFERFPSAVDLQQPAFASPFARLQFAPLARLSTSRNKAKTLKTASYASVKRCRTLACPPSSSKRLWATLSPLSSQLANCSEANCLKVYREKMLESREASHRACKAERDRSLGLPRTQRKTT